MKRNGLRALGLVTCMVALFSILGLALSDATLIGIVKSELVPEISNAAGLNLVDYYIATYTVEELTDLAANGLTPGIKLAADRALFKINGGLLAYVNLDDDTLLAEAAAGNQDAADAYVFNHRASVKNPTAVMDALAATADPDVSGIETVVIAYGKLLGGYYGPGSPVGMKTEDELLDLVINGSLAERVAAATALTTYWILGSDMTINDVETQILANTLWHPELALAYQGYLTYLFSL
jgi:hypothetical protein